MALADSLIAYKIIRALTTPFKDMPAHKLGIIDDHGNMVKYPVTPTEKEAYNPFYRIIIRLKLLLGKLPVNQQLASYAAAVALVKEDNIEEMTDEELIESINNKYSDDVDLIGFKAMLEDGEGGMAAAPAASTVPNNTVANIKGTITGVGKKAKMRYFRRSKVNM